MTKEPDPTALGARIAAIQEQDRLRQQLAGAVDALDALWTIVLNDVPCSAERPCEVCASVYAKVRSILNGPGGL